jgi:DUF971 family protein
MSSPAATAFMEIAKRLAAQVSVVNEATRSVKHRPSEVKLFEAHIEIRWSDGHVSRYGQRDLRLACPCAECIDEWTGVPRLDPRTVRPDVKAEEMRPVGRYAIQFMWSDGHASGIYTYDKLRALDTGAPDTPPPGPRMVKLPMAR